MISKDQRKLDMLEALVNAVDKETQHKSIGQIDFGEWPVAENILLDGKPFTFKNHEYLIEPYKDKHPFQVEIKATQMGLTSKALLRVIYGARYGNYRGILYLFPSRSDVTDLSKTRLTPLIEDNPDTIGQWVTETDAANVKKIWNSFVYLRGMRSKVGLKSIPVDFEVFDELDEAPQNSVDMALERMAHSAEGDLLFLSNPTLPDYGIDKLFCVAPNTKILTTELRHIEARELKLGDELIGFDEQKKQENKTRCYRRTNVIALKKVFLPSVRLHFDNGNTVVCSKQHRWLTEIHGNVRFKFTKNMKPGDKLFSIGTWEEDCTRKGGWVSGIYDGEGSVGCSKKEERRGTATYISFTQKLGVVLDTVKEYLSDYNFDTQVGIAHKDGYGDCHNLRIKGGLPERLRFMGTFRPVRLMPKHHILWEGRSVGNDAGNTKKPVLTKIEELGIVELIAIETDCKTYIANGLLSHNSSTDMKYFLLKCPHCNEYNNLVDTFPDCLVEFRGKTFRACSKCGKELDVNKGEWVAKRPSITERRGRQFSQLYMSTRTTSPEFMLNKFRTTTNLTDFYNLKIGVAYVDAQNRLSVQEVLDCCGDQGMSSSCDDGTFMGVDQGNHLHVTIGKRGDKRKAEVIYADVLRGNNNIDRNDDSGWKQLDALMARFKVMRCVVDAQPNTKAARSFAERFPGRVFLCYYSEYQKGCYKWSEKDMTVYANRTESLDSTHKDIVEQNVLLPRQSDTIKLFAEHMHNVTKRLETNDETGSQKYVYLRLGADHFRHSFNYMAMALADSPKLIFPELM
jgi:hypothetical protein